MIQTTAEAASQSNEFDVREIPCRIKHGQILERWEKLPLGSHFVLVNDHEPVPLFYQFEAQYPGQFTWEPLSTGPDVFRIRITRIAPASKAAGAKPSLPIACEGTDPAVDLDLRGMEPPEPMMRILNAVNTLKAGVTLKARTDRRPVNLFAELESRGLCHYSEPLPDGTWITTLKRP